MSLCRWLKKNSLNFGKVQEVAFNLAIVSKNPSFKKGFKHLIGLITSYSASFSLNLGLKYLNVCKGYLV